MLTTSKHSYGDTVMDNDNLPLLLRTQGILNRFRNAAQLSEQKQDKDERDAADQRRQDQKQDSNLEKLDNERRYIEHRLREIRAWEKRISGNR